MSMDDTYLVGAPTDPQLRRIGEDIIAEVHAAALKAFAHAADPSKFTPADPLERLLVRRLQEKPADRVSRAATRATAHPGPPALGAVDIAAPIAVAAQLAKVSPGISLTRDGLLSVLEQPGISHGTEHMGMNEEQADPDIKKVKPFLNLVGLEAAKKGQGMGAIVLKAPVKAPQMGPLTYGGVRLRLHKLVCVEDTTGLGSDEISLAGIAIAANGAAHKISPFLVSENFDKGETVQFGISFDPKTGKLTDSGPIEFYRFEYAADNTVMYKSKSHEEIVKVDWPRVFQFTFLLAEIDNGGFPNFVNDLFELIKGKVAQVVAAAVGAAVGGWVGGIAGSPIPGLGNAIGAAVGALAGWILGEIWHLFMDWWEDDEFTPITVAVKRKNPLETFVNGTSFDSSNKEVWWKGHGGYYKLKFDWQMVGLLAP